MKKRIKKWLGIENLENRMHLFREHAAEQRKRAEKAEKHAKFMEAMANAAAQRAEEAERKAERLAEAFHVGTDINPSGYDKSWAVVCIKGKIDRVEFIDLTPMDAREVQRFLSMFKKENVRLDVPIGMKFLTSK